MKKRIYIFIFCFMAVNVLVGCNGTADTNAGTENLTEVTSEEHSFSVASEDGCTIIQITTLKDNDQYCIKKINVIKNGVTLNSINDIVGYYDNISLDNQASLAAINYYGRKWRNFILLDMKSGQIIYNEPFNFADIKSAYKDKGNKMDYETNDYYLRTRF